MNGKFQKVDTLTRGIWLVAYLGGLSGTIVVTQATLLGVANFSKNVNRKTHRFKISKHILPIMSENLSRKHITKSKIKKYINNWFIFCKLKDIKMM